ncbi:MAG: hypothetical protein QG591_2224 [Planctomycetota bacterium]|nr:hypothetical protein [Planctomycetota bacterium]
MLQLLKQTHYVMRSQKGPVLFVNDKDLAELLLSKANVKFKQDIKPEIYETKGIDQKRTFN